jgi:ferric-dicitrate binding protein FerR (iron transport regulator)
VDQNQDIAVNLELIGRYLAGEATPEEALALDTWRASAPENDAEFNNVARLWDEMKPMDAYPETESKSEWSKVQTTLHLDIGTGPKKIGILLRPWTVAASFLILAGAIAVAYIIKNRATPATFKSMAGSEHAVVTDTLSDLSTVTLTPGSQLAVASGYNIEGRRVKINGEGYFDVATLENRPFTAEVGNLKIMVLGTRFNVKDDSEVIIVSVDEGIVKVSDRSKSITVSGGSTGIYNKGSRTFDLYEDSLNRNSYSYATGILYFYDMPLGEVKKVLESTYDVRIVFESPTLEGYKINTKFTRQSLTYVLKVISASLGIDYRIDGKTVYISENVDN